jgi:plastocyanin
MIATSVAAAPAFADVSKTAATVVIDNFSFSPARLSVAVGSTVTWENHDDIPHTIVNDATPRDFKSPPVDSGEKFSQTFLKPGTYRYFCSLHPHMTGTVVVK